MKLATFLNRFFAILVTIVTVPVVIVLWNAQGGHPPPVILIPLVLVLFSGPAAACGVISGVFELRRGHKSWLSYLAFAVNVIFVAAAVVVLVVAVVGTPRSAGF